MKDQLHKIMEAEGLTPTRFAEEIGVQRSSISHIISGRNKPSFDFITKILKRFNGINADWLLTGNGNMIKGKESSDSVNKPENLLFNVNNDSNGQLKRHKQQETNDQPTESYKSIKALSQNTASIKDNTPHNKQITNVNNVKYILVFYENGEFDQFNARELDN